MNILLLGRVFYESVRQAIQQLLSNKLRTFLSLLGITIGIWCVIMVFSVIDSLEGSIQNSFQQLGDDLVFVSPFPWAQMDEENFYKYFRRPQPNHRDFTAIKKHAKNARIASYNVMLGSGVAESKRGTVEGTAFFAITEDYKDMFDLEFFQGRYFAPLEFYKGTNQAILGHDVTAALFPNDKNPIGKYFKVKGQKLQVIGVLKKEGKDLLNPTNFDEVILVPYNTARKFVNIMNSGQIQGRTSITVRPKAGVSVDQLKDELTGVLRAERKLRPREESNFSLNTLSLLAGIIESVFSVIRFAGFFIGIFAIIVGVFNVANIMFVSVKERTNLIGIKKALGAKRYIILIEFLIESIVLCLIGGALGLVLVYLASLAATHYAEFNIFLSYKNAVIGLGASTIAGVIAGIVPAFRAANMVPVEAIRA